MNRTAIISLGVIATVVASLLGLVLIPEWQARSYDAVSVTRADGSEVLYPQPLDSFREAPGRQVYISEGCIYCHSQQVRPEGFGADIERGWGMRRSVPRDYLLESPTLLGTMRTGPDLANIGIRQPSEDWHYKHLYDPQITSPGSVMPPFRFLFETYEEKPAGESYELPEDYEGEARYIVPTEEARQLVAYLKALRQEHDFEDVR